MIFLTQRRQFHCIPPAVVAAGIAGIASVVNSLLGKSDNDNTNEAQFELLKYQYDRNLEQWRIENEYNTPRNQMQRFEVAGLNPNLIYSQNNTGGSISVPSSSGYRPFTNYRIGESVGQSYLSGLATSSQLKLQQSQSDLNDANYDLVQEKIDLQGYENLIKKIELAQQKYLNSENDNERSIWKRQIDAALSSLESDSKMKSYLAEQERIGIDIKSQQLENTKQVYREVEAKIDNIIQSTELTKSQRALISQQILESAARTRLHNAQASESEFRLSIEKELKSTLVNYGISPTGSEVQQLGYVLYKLFETPKGKEALNYFKSKLSGSNDPLKDPFEYDRLLKGTQKKNNLER